MRQPHLILPRLVLLIFVCLTVPGCKKTEQPATTMQHDPPPLPAQAKGGLQGHVRYHGVGVPAGYVKVYGPDGKSVTGGIKMGGTYQVVDPPLGSVKIAVQAHAPSDVSRAPPATTRPGMVLPPRYADPDTSGLTITITGGEQYFDINLVD